MNSQYLAMLLRIADYLDIDEERAPYYLYQYLSPKDYGDMEWRQHFVIENKEKIVIDAKTEKKNIEFYGESSNPDIHRKLLKYFDAINGELKSAVDYSETFREKNTYCLSEPQCIIKSDRKDLHFRISSCRSITKLLQVCSWEKTSMATKSTNYAS